MKKVYEAWPKTLDFEDAKKKELKNLEEPIKIVECVANSQNDRKKNIFRLEPKFESPKPWLILKVSWVCCQTIQKPKSKSPAELELFRQKEFTRKMVPNLNKFK